MLCWELWLASKKKKKKSIWKMRNEKEILFEHHCHCHWWVPMKKGREIKAAAEPLAVKDSPCQGGEGQSLSKASAHLPHSLQAFQKPALALFTLRFEVDCKLYLLIPIATVAYAHFTMHMFSIHLSRPTRAQLPLGTNRWTGTMLICDGSIYTKILAETFVTVRLSGSNWGASL